MEDGAVAAESRGHVYFCRQVGCGRRGIDWEGEELVDLCRHSRLKD